MKLLSRINCLTKSILWNNVEILWNHWAEQTPDLSWSYIFIKQSKLLIKVDLIKSTSRVNCLSTLILWIIEQNKLLIQSWSYVIIEQSQLLINVYLMKESSRVNCCFKVDLMKSFCRVKCRSMLILWNHQPVSTADQSWSNKIIEQSKLLIKDDHTKAVRRVHRWFKVYLKNDWEE